MQHHTEATVIHKIRRFLKAQSGSTAMEYALIAAFLSIVIIAGVTAIGETTSENFSSVNSALDGD